MGISYNTSIVRDGLVLHLDAANSKSYPGSGTTWYDLSGNGNDGNMLNSPSYTTEYKGGIVRNGSTHYILVPITVETTTTNFTVSTWLKAQRSMSNYDVIVSAWNTSSGGAGGWELQINSSGVLGVHGTYSTPFTDNEVINVVYVHDGTTVKIYLNGVLKQTSSSTVDLRTGNIGIGNLSASGVADSYGTAGTFYNVLLYQKSLSEDEIKQNFNALKTRYSI